MNNKTNYTQDNNEIVPANNHIIVQTQQCRQQAGREVSALQPLDRFPPLGGPDQEHRRHCQKNTKKGTAQKDRTALPGNPVAAARAAQYTQDHQDQVDLDITHRQRHCLPGKHTSDALIEQQTSVNPDRVHIHLDGIHRMG